MIKFLKTAMIGVIIQRKLEINIPKFYEWTKTDSKFELSFYKAKFKPRFGCKLSKI